MRTPAAAPFFFLSDPPDPLEIARPFQYNTAIRRTDDDRRGMLFTEPTNQSAPFPAGALVRLPRKQKKKRSDDL